MRLTRRRVAQLALAFIAIIGIIFALLPSRNQALNAQTVITTVALTPDTGTNGIAVNTSTGHAFPVNSGTNTISIIRPSDNGKDPNIQYGSTPTVDAVNSTTHTLYVVSQGNNRVGAINPVTLDVTDIDIVSRPVGITLDQNLNHVFVSSFNNSGAELPAVSIIFGGTNQVTREITDADGLPSGPRQITVNTTTHKVYVAHTNGSVSVIDGSSGTFLKNFPAAASPTAIAANSQTNRIYLVSGGTVNTVTVIDGSTDTVIGTITGLGTSLTGAAVNESRNHIYVADGGGQALDVIDGATNQFVSIPLPTASPTAIAANPTNNRVYVTHFSAAKVTVIDDSGSFSGPTPTPSSTGAGTSTPTITSTRVPSSTSTPLATATTTPAASSTQAPSNTPTATATSTSTEGPTSTGTPFTPTSTSTVTQTATLTSTATATTVPATSTPANTATITPTFSTGHSGGGALVAQQAAEQATAMPVVSTRTPTPGLPLNVSTQASSIQIMGPRSVSGGDPVKVSYVVPNDGKTYEIRLYNLSTNAVVSTQSVVPGLPRQFTSPSTGQYRFGLFQNGGEIARTIALIVVPNASASVSPNSAITTDSVTLSWANLKSSDDYTATLIQNDNRRLITSFRIARDTGSTEVDLSDPAHPVRPGVYQFLLSSSEYPNVYTNTFEVKQGARLTLPGMVRLSSTQYALMGGQADVAWDLGLGSDSSGTQLRLWRHDNNAGNAWFVVQDGAIPSASGDRQFAVDTDHLYQADLYRQGQIVADSPSFIVTSGQPDLVVDPTRVNAGGTISLHYTLPEGLTSVPAQITMHSVVQPETMLLDEQTISNNADGWLQFRAPDPSDPTDYFPSGVGFYNFRLSINGQPIPLAREFDAEVRVQSPSLEMGSRSVLANKGTIGGQVEWVEWHDYATSGNASGSLDWVGLYRRGSSTPELWSMISTSDGHVGFATPRDGGSYDIRFYAADSLVKSLPLDVLPLSQQTVAGLTTAQQGQLFVNFLEEDSPLVDDYLNGSLTVDQLANVMSLAWAYDGYLLSDWIVERLDPARAAAVIVIFESR